VAAGTGALLVLIVIIITGGFVIDVGPLHFSARRVTGPLAIAFAAWATAAVLGRAPLAASAVSLSNVLDIHATAIAVILSAAAAGAGIAHGTYSAAGADASGYLSQAELLASGRIAQDEPLARQGTWPEGTWTFAPLGYRPGLHPGELVPTYPPGVPLTMAVARRVAGEFGPFLVAPLLGALAVFCTYLLGVTLYSRTAGAIASALIATSPIVLFQIVQPMSDVPVTAWWALAMALALSRRRGSAAAAGLAAGVALLTRPNLLPLLLPAALAASGWPAGRAGVFHMRRLGLFLAGTAPAVAALLLLQWRLYGTPFVSGYGRFDELFAIGAVIPNLRAYAWRLATGEGPALALGLASLIALALPPRLERPQGLARPAWPCAGVFVAVLVCYLPYAVFSDWSYLRFLMPALPLTLVVVASLLTAAVTRLPHPARGIVLLAVVVSACSLNVVRAGGEQAFNLRRYDARYRTAGHYLDAVLPDHAVVLAVQESGSVRHYARVPIVRWDLIGADLDGTIAALRALGRQPMLLIEDWERRDFASRFRTSPLAALDWPPRAVIGDDTRVLLFDPADRGGAGAARVADRLH